MPIRTANPIEMKMPSIETISILYSYGFLGGQTKIATTVIPGIPTHTINCTTVGNSKKNLPARAVAAATFNRSNNVRAIISRLKSVKIGCHIPSIIYYSNKFAIRKISGIISGRYTQNISGMATYPMVYLI